MGDQVREIPSLLVIGGRSSGRGRPGWEGVGGADQSPGCGRRARCLGGVLGSVSLDVLGRGVGGVAWPEVGTVTVKTSTHWARAASTVSATRWAVLWWRPRVMPTYAAAAPVASPMSRCAWSTVSPWAPWTVVALGELDVVADVVRGQVPCAAAAPYDEPAVGVRAGHGPLVAVGDAEVAVVASRCDLVAGAEPLAGCGRHRCGRAGLAGGESLLADGGVEGGDLLAGVRDDRSVDVGECGEAFDLGGVDL